MTKKEHIKNLREANAAYDAKLGTWDGVVKVMKAWRDQEDAVSELKDIRSGHTKAMIH